MLQNAYYVYVTYTLRMRISSMKLSCTMNSSDVDADADANANVAACACNNKHIYIVNVYVKLNWMQKGGNVKNVKMFCALLASNDERTLHLLAHPQWRQFKNCFKSAQLLSLSPVHSVSLSHSFLSLYRVFLAVPIWRLSGKVQP